jgi:cobalamin biosynthesis Co2+ chelatase CbiK
MAQILNTETGELRLEGKQTPNQDYERLCERYKTKQIGFEEFKIGMLLLHFSNDYHISYNQIDSLAKELRNEQ